jgi:hypothetical protein
MERFTRLQDAAIRLATAAGAIKADAGLTFMRDLPPINYRLACIFARLGGQSSMQQRPKQSLRRHYCLFPRRGRASREEFRMVPVAMLDIKKNL